MANVFTVTDEVAVITSHITLLINQLLPLSEAQLCRRTESQWGMHWHWVMGLYPGQLCWYTGSRWAWRGPADAHIINAERDECGSVHCCTSPQSGGETCISASAFTRLHPKKKKKTKKGRTWFCFLFTTTFSHHMVSPLLGMVRQLNVSPQQPTHIPPLIIISKSRAAYALNIRLLCMVINPITHMDKCTAPWRRYRSAQDTPIFIPN